MQQAPFVDKDQVCKASVSPVMSGRQTLKDGPYCTMRVPTHSGESQERTRTHTSASKSKSTNLQHTMRKPIKIKMFEKDTEKMKVMCFEFPIDGTVPTVEEMPSDEGFGGLIVQNMNATAYRGLALSKFKILRSFFSNYQEEKKRVQRHDMNVLGLRIKKVDYCSKVQPRDERAFKASGSRNRQRSSQPVCEEWDQKTQEESSVGLDGHNAQSRMTTIHRGSHSELDLPRSQSRTECRRTSLMNTTAKRIGSPKKNPKLSVSNTNQYSNKIYEARIQKLQEFVFRMNFAHNVYVEQFDLGDPELQSGKCETKYRMWLGAGNNSLLIKSLMKRRFWWSIENDKHLSSVNFVWSQLKDNNLFLRQKPSTVQQLHHKMVCDLEAQTEEDDSPRRPKNRMKLIVPEDLCKIMSKKHEVAYLDAALRATNRKHNNASLSNIKNLSRRPLLTVQSKERVLMHNHLQNNFFLGNKKAMFHNLKQYYELCEDNAFNYLPLTFHIKNGLKDPQYRRFVHYFKKRAAYIKQQEKECDQEQDCPRPRKKKLRNIWIVKPGQLSNRGNGITVVDELYEVNSLLTRKDSHANGTAKTYIVQLYIDRPMLYNRRKFDIRHYMMVSSLYGVVRGYWYSEGYIRTSGYEFDVHNFEREIHLTNDAVQKLCGNYGFYQPANKLSYAEFQRYLDSAYPRKKYSFARQILPRMKQIATDAVRSVALKISPSNLQHNFEIFGLDFMIDENFRPWLIQINTNPCLELCCPLLSRLIPLMVEQSLRLTLDVVFPPPCHYSNNNRHLVPDLGLAGLKYQLIFDSQVDGEELRKLYRNVKTSRLRKHLPNVVDEIGEISDDEEYADNGVELKIDAL